MRGFCQAWYSPIVLYFACMSGWRPENGSGGLVSKPNSVMNSSRPVGIALFVFDARSSSSRPRLEMFAIVSESGFGSTTVGGTFFVYGWWA